MKQSEWLQHIKSEVQISIEQAQHNKQLPLEQLIFRIGDSWNTLECYEHMNRFGTLYLRYFEDAIDRAKVSSKDKVYKSGWLGGWSIRSMDTKPVGVKMPMKTLKMMNPKGEELDALVIDMFVKQQKQMLVLLDQAQGHDIDAVRCRTSIKLLKFKLSDAFGFFFQHNKRHLVQASRILEKAA